MYDSPLKLVIDFGRYGNSASFCRTGWDEPELAYTRMSGPSVLELPIPDQPGEYLLRFDVLPTDEDTNAIPPRLTVLVNGVEVGRFEVRERTSLECPVDWQSIAGSAAVSIEFHVSEAANGAHGTSAALGFSTLILFRMTDTEAAAVPEAAPETELAAEPEAAAVPEPAAEPEAAILPAAQPPDGEAPPQPCPPPQTAPLPAPVSRAGGCVDIYGYCEAARGWLVVGWLRREPTSGRSAQPADRVVAATVHFGGTAIAGQFAVAFYPRADLQEGGVGFVMVLQGEPLDEPQLTALELGFTRGMVRLTPFTFAEKLGKGETIDWISRVVINVNSDPAVSSLLLLSTAGREVDAEYYLARYPDVRSLGIKPAEHYIEMGWRDGRDPNHWFCTKDYLELNPEVAASGYNPLYHYVAFGRREGRRPHNRSAEWETVAREFDPCFYLAANLDVANQQEEPIQHYLDHGWREHRDPVPWFSTDYYLERQHGIVEHGTNPFYHYIQFGRAQGRRPCQTRSLPYKPLVSVIVPSYNHAEFLGERLDLILQQTYAELEILVLDDASSDGSRDFIEHYLQQHPSRIRALYNDANSGSVFHQWRQGLNRVNGDLVWICESDDSCERDFLEHLVPYFIDPSIMLAFGRTQFIDAQGIESNWLDIYRESAAPGLWDDPHIATAHDWFRGPFAVRNVIPNVGGCVFRRQSLPECIWDEATQYRILGDWFLYAQLAGGGRIAYDPNAVSFFRRHSRNTSIQNHKQDYFWVEHLRLGKMLRVRFGPPDEISFRFYRILSDLYAEIFGEDRREDLKRLIDLNELLRAQHTQKHILIAIYGFHTGGGEVFAIHLANQLIEMGHIVSVACVVEHPFLDNAGIRQMLDPRIAVYEREVIDEIGVERFLATAGVDVIHSHYLEAEQLFFAKNDGRLNIPYVVTLHGSYEAWEEMGRPLSAKQLLACLRGVNYWTYLAENNLDHLKDIPIEKERLIRLPNALKINDAPFPYARQDIGADPDTVIFGMASRAVEDKGWEESIEALRLARQEAGVRLMLVLCGDGPELDRLEPLYRADPNVKFLGFQPNIHGFFRLCDCCLLPSRFAGESFPLTLVQSFQVGTPAIATDVGEIPSMMQAGGVSAGILLRFRRHETFVRDIAQAMLKMSDHAYRATKREAAATIGSGYDLEALAQRYLSIYAKAGQWN